MLIEVVTFGLPEGMDRDELIENYERTTSKWRNVGDLIRKSYIFDGEKRVGGGIYHWKSVQAADHWHGEEWRHFIKDLYGSEPVVRRFEVPIVVDNEVKHVLAA